MNFGSIIGSISPAFGIASGQGLFGHGGLGGVGLAARLAGGGAKGAVPGAIQGPAPAMGGAPAPAPAPTIGGDGDGPDREGRREDVMEGAQPLAHMGGPDMAAAVNGLPQLKPQGGGLHLNPQAMQGILASLQMMAPGGRRF